MKSPATDALKTSKPGRLILMHENGQFKTGVEGDGTNVLQEVFHNGHVMELPSMVAIRQRAALQAGGIE